MVASTKLLGIKEEIALLFCFCGALYVLGHTETFFLNDSSVADKTESCWFVVPRRMQTGAKELGINFAMVGVLLRRPRCRFLHCRCMCSVAALSVS